MCRQLFGAAAARERLRDTLTLPNRKKRKRANFAEAGRWPARGDGAGHTDPLTLKKEKSPSEEGRMAAKARPAEELI